MLLMLDFDEIIGALMQFIDTVFIYINSFIYNFVSFVYQIFLALAGAQIFSSEMYRKIANNIYIIIGVVTLFIIAYALLKAIIDPDGTSKSEYSVQKLVPNVIKTILLIGLTPVIFSAAYNMQDIIVSTNVIPNIITGDGSKGSNEELTYANKGRELANDIFTAFMYAKDVSDDEIEIRECWFAAPDCEGIDPPGETAYNFAMAKEEVSGKVEGRKKDFGVYANFGKKMHGEDKQIEYNALFQLAAGIIVVYVLINYCIDLGVRAVKLGYFQIIAPIPILMNMIPGQSKAFNNWVKSTIQTFVDVFFRIGIMYLGLFVIESLPKVGSDFWQHSYFANDPTVQNFARAFLIVGLLIFIKQAPKLLSDMFGIQGSGFKLGIKDKLGEMAGVGNAAKNALQTAQDKTVGATTGALGGAWGSLVNKGSVRKGLKAGMLSGMKDGGRQFKNQLQSIYSQGGGKGKAGMFGGQQWVGRKSDKYNDEYKDDYQDRVLSARVNRGTDVANPKTRAHEYYTEQLKDITASAQADADYAKAEKDKAETKLNDIRANFENDKQRQLKDIEQKIMADIAGGGDGSQQGAFKPEYLRMLIKGKDEFNNKKAADLAVMKNEIDKIESANNTALASAKTAWESSNTAEIAKLEQDKKEQEAKFVADKRAKETSLLQSINSLTAAGDFEKANELQSQFNELAKSQFDSSALDSKILEKRNAKFEDSEAYKTIKVKQDAALQTKQSEYTRYLNMEFEDTDNYKTIMSNATENVKNLYTQYSDAYNSKVEDTTEYKEASADYDEKMATYTEQANRLDDRSELIIKNVYDPNKKKLVKKVYNLHAPADATDDEKYIDLDDKAGVEKAKVTAVEKAAYDASIKELKDKNETFKALDTAFAKRINEKEDADWLKTEEGRHMDILIKELKKGASSEGDKK